MDDLQEAAEMALEWIEAQPEPRMIGAQACIEALRKALETEADEWYEKLLWGDKQASREWVGLTKEELQDLCAKSYYTDNAGEIHFNRGYFADAIEAKLKEKNT